MNLPVRTRSSARSPSNAPHDLKRGDVSFLPGNVIPLGEILRRGLGQRDHRKGEHLAARLHVSAECAGVVGEGDVGVDATCEHGTGDGDDVVGTLALDEDILRGKVGAADDVEVIAGERPGAGDEDAVLDTVLGDGALEGVEEVLAGIDADHDHSGDGGFVGSHVFSLLME